MEGASGGALAGGHAATGELPWRRAPPELQGKGKGEAGCSGTPGAVRCQKAGDGAGRGPWSWDAAPVCATERSRWAYPALQCRSLRAMVEGLALPPDFGLLPWEFASAISWNMNLFIFKREQT